MIQKSLFPISFFLLIGTASAQKVESTAYNILLKGLLSHSVHEIDVSQADSLHESALFLDSREAEEYQVSHIENSVFVGYDSLDLSPLKKVDKNEEIVVYCAVGYRSEKVAEKLVEMGYTNVHNLYGGIFEWKNQQKEIVNKHGTPTDRIHVYKKVWGVWVKEGEKVY